MAIKGKFDEKSKDEEVFVIKFTNGNLKQLRELQNYLETKNFPFSIPEDPEVKLAEVVVAGIGFVEHFKELDDKK
jgi:hypothetical protein